MGAGPWATCTLHGTSEFPVQVAPTLSHTVGGNASCGSCLALESTDMTDDRYFDEWAENTEIAWWNDGRRQLNIIIRLVNAWTLDGCPGDQVERLLRHIEMGCQTFAAQDGGGGWLNCLQGMREYVTNRSR